MSLNRQQRRAQARQELRAQRKAERQGTQTAAERGSASAANASAPHPDTTPEDTAPRERTPENPNGSTGPRTAAGKARSSQNAAKHLLSCTTFRLQHDEEEEEYHFIRLQFAKEYAPADMREMALVESIAQSFWLRQRAIRLLSQEGVSCSQVNTYLRYQSTQDRAFFKFRAELAAVQKARKEEEQGIPELKRRALKLKVDRAEYQVQRDEYQLAEEASKAIKRLAADDLPIPQAA